VKVLKSDGKVLEKNEDLSTSNFFMHSLFDMVEVFINGKLVTCNLNYFYIAYLLTTLTYSNEYKKQKLNLTGYYPDSFNDKLDATNTGYTNRKELIKESTTCELVGNLYSDLFLQDRYLLPETDVRIRIRRAPVQFSLLGNTAKAYKIEIMQATMYIRKLVENLRRSHLDLLSKNQKA